MRIGGVCYVVNHTMNRRMPVVFVYSLIAVNVLSIIVCHGIARSRGARPVFWGMMGAIFGPFAIPFALRASAG